MSLILSVLRELANICRLGLSDFLREKVVQRLRKEEERLQG